MKVRLYFDACCLNRLTDDQSQDRIRQEAEAVEKLLGLATSNWGVWISSVVLAAEISRNPDLNRRQDAETLLTFAHETVELNDQIIGRARELRDAGFSEFDALHLACSEHARVEVFLTTDDRLIRRAQRGAGNLAFRVLNPVFFWEELQNADARDE
ncbi:MAG: PIN domain-containing protein [Acidobacteriaceae bacterium]|nr:PIN domain-containing protein [Acidobacteriaceae bacterium]